MRWLSISRRLLAGCASGLLLSAAGLALCLLIWQLQGKRVVAVQSNSMKPSFQAGDAVLINTKLIARARPGQVVGYRSLTDSQVMVSHRLMTFNPATGKVVTQGDALAAADPPITRTQIAGVVTAVLPGFGRLLNLVRQPFMLALILYVPAALVVWQEIARLSQRLARPTYRLLRQQ